MFLKISVSALELYMWLNWPVVYLFAISEQTSFTASLSLNPEEFVTMVCPCIF